MASSETLENKGRAHLATLSIDDRFCIRCGFRLHDAMLGVPERCPRCSTPVPRGDDEFWNECIQCHIFVKCTFKYCQLCGRKNSNFNPEKPSRVERARSQKLNLLEESLKKEIIAKELAQDKLKQLKEEDLLCTEGSLLYETSQLMETGPESDSSNSVEGGESRLAKSVVSAGEKVDEKPIDMENE